MLLILSALPFFGSVLGADGVAVKFSGNERILMPPSVNDLEKEWEKTDRMGGFRSQPSDPVPSFIPSGGIPILKKPNLRKLIAERGSWLSQKSESDINTLEKALGVREDFSTKNDSSRQSGEPENTSKTDAKADKKDSARAAASSWDEPSNKSSNTSAKKKPDSNSTEPADSSYKSSSASPMSLKASPLPDLNRSGDARYGKNSRSESGYQAQRISPLDLGGMPSLSEPGSLMKQDRVRMAELRRKEDFQNLLQARSPGSDLMGGANDPINLWQDKGSAEMNPVVGSNPDDLSARSKSDFFGLNQSGAASLSAAGRPSFLDSLSAKSMGQGSLLPVLTPIATPEFRPNPGILEMPLRRKF